MVASVTQILIALLIFFKGLLVSIRKSATIHTIPLSQHVRIKLVGRPPKGICGGLTKGGNSKTVEWIITTSFTGDLYALESHCSTIIIEVHLSWIGVIVTFILAGKNQTHDTDSPGKGPADAKAKQKQHQKHILHEILFFNLSKIFFTTTVCRPRAIISVFFQGLGPVLSRDW